MNQKKEIQKKKNSSMCFKNSKKQTQWNNLVWCGFSKKPKNNKNKVCKENDEDRKKSVNKVKNENIEGNIVTFYKLGIFFVVEASKENTCDIKKAFIWILWGFIVLEIEVKEVELVFFEKKVKYVK